MLFFKYFYFILIILVFFGTARLTIERIDDGIDTCASDEHPSKAPLPIE